MIARHSKGEEQAEPLAEWERELLEQGSEDRAPESDEAKAAAPAKKTAPKAADKKPAAKKTEKPEAAPEAAAETPVAETEADKKDA